MKNGRCYEDHHDHIILLASSLGSHEIIHNAFNATLLDFYKNDSILGQPLETNMAEQAKHEVPLQVWHQFEV